MRRLLRSTLLLVLGACLGAAAVVPLVSLRMEALLLERDRMILAHNRLQANYRSLEERIEQQRPPAVREVRLRLQGVPDPARRLALEEALEPYLDQLRGQPLGGVDPALAAALFHNRLIEAQGRTYLLRLQWLVLGEISLLQIEAERKESTASVKEGAAASAERAATAGKAATAADRTGESAGGTVGE